MGETVEKIKSIVLIVKEKILIERKKAVILIASAALALLGLVLLIWYLAARGTAVPEEPAEEPAETPAPTATPEPEPLYEAGYFICPDGLFYPERVLTLGEAGSALERAAGESVSVSGDRETALTETAFAAFLTEYFPEGQVADAMESIAGRGGETVTRAEAAVCLNLLFGLTEREGDMAPFPDVAPDYWAGDAVRIAATASGEAPAAADGFCWADGYLYCLGDDGYFVKNRYVGSLFFGPDGRYTSGSLELDRYVAELIRENTDDSMTREERLRAAFDYVRDNFTYLIRHYYRIGDVGWQLEEALTMFSTGKGNCYCYAAAFWAAARGLGYDAKIVSGTVNDGAPHGWVEMQQDGERITYDVELEMVLRNKERQKNVNLYAMTDAQRRGQGYIEQPMSDDLVPRETNEGLLPR